VQQRGGVDKFHRSGQLVMMLASITHQLRARDRQHGAHALAPARYQMAGKLGDERDVALHPVGNYGVDPVHAGRGKRQQRIERWSAGQLGR